MSNTDSILTAPAPGHFVISGHRPSSVFVPDVGHVVPADECHIPASVPSAILEKILAARKAAEEAATPGPDNTEPAPAPVRKSKAKAAEEAATTEPVPAE